MEKRAEQERRLGREGSQVGGEPGRTGLPSRPAPPRAHPELALHLAVASSALPWEISFPQG